MKRHFFASKLCALSLVLSLINTDITYIKPYERQSYNLSAPTIFKPLFKRSNAAHAQYKFEKTAIGEQLSGCDKMTLAYIASLIGEYLSEGMSPDTIISEIKYHIARTDLDRAAADDPVLAGLDLDRLTYNAYLHEYALPIERKKSPRTQDALLCRFYTDDRAYEKPDMVIPIDNARNVFIRFETISTDRVRSEREKSLKFYDTLLNDRTIDIEYRSYKLRAIAGIIRLYSLYLCKFRGNHLGSCMSLADIIAVLYGGKMLHYSLSDNKLTGTKDSDPMFLSIGHSASAFYAMFHMLGLVEKNQLVDARSKDGLPGHPESRLSPNIVYMSSGSLGQGLSEAVGAAMVTPEKKVFVFTGDGEIQEGNVQEAIQFAGRSTRLDNLIAIIDYNKIQLSGAVSGHGTDLESIRRNFADNGWNVLVVNGHDPDDLEIAFNAARSNTGAPTAVITDTIMGKGVSFMEEAARQGKSTYHHGRGAIKDDMFKQAEQEILAEIQFSLDSINPGLFPLFRSIAIKPDDFIPPDSGIIKCGGKMTNQEAFANTLCELVKDGVPIAYLVGDLTGSSSVGASKIRKAIDEKRASFPSYRGFYEDVGIRELSASTMLKGIARASEERDSEGRTLRQKMVPVFSCYAAMINLVTEPIRVAARDNLQFILNATQFGLLFASGGNSHNTAVIGLSNFMPVFVPVSESETETIVRTSSERILNGGFGKCCIATSRFKIGEVVRDGQTVLDDQTVDEVNTLCRTAWQDPLLYDKGAYIVGNGWADDEVDATIVTSGSMLYFVYKVKQELEKKGIKVRVINVVKFSRQYSEYLRNALDSLLPGSGYVFTVWEGDRNILFDRVAAAIAAGRHRPIKCIPLGPSEESDANGTIMQVTNDFGLWPENIVDAVTKTVLPGVNAWPGSSSFAMNTTPVVWEQLKRSITRLEKVLVEINPNCNVKFIKVAPCALTRGVMIGSSDIDDMNIYIEGASLEELNYLSLVFRDILADEGLIFKGGNTVPQLNAFETINETENALISVGKKRITLYEFGSYRPFESIYRESFEKFNLNFNKYTARIALMLLMGELDPKYAAIMLKPEQADRPAFNAMKYLIEYNKELSLSPIASGLVVSLDTLLNKQEKIFYYSPRNETDIQAALFELCRKGLITIYDNKLILMWRSHNPMWGDSFWRDLITVRREGAAPSDDAYITSRVMADLADRENENSPDAVLWRMLPRPEIFHNIPANNGSPVPLDEQDKLIALFGAAPVINQAQAVEFIKMNVLSFSDRIFYRIKSLLEQPGADIIFTPTSTRIMNLMNFLPLIAEEDPTQADKTAEFVLKEILSQKNIPEFLLHPSIKIIGKIFPRIQSQTLRSSLIRKIKEYVPDKIPWISEIALDVLTKISSDRPGLSLKSMAEVSGVLGEKPYVAVYSRSIAKVESDDYGFKVTDKIGGSVGGALEKLFAQKGGGIVLSVAVTPEEKMLAETDKLLGIGDNIWLRYIASPPDEYKNFNYSFSNPFLWFLHHEMLAQEPERLNGLPLLGEKLRAAYGDYKKVNYRFAHDILLLTRHMPTARIIFQDYHLYLAPGIIRKAGQSVHMSHFLHTPWPDTNYLKRHLPQNVIRELLEGILSNDKFGLHTRQYAENFIEACVQLLGASYIPERNIVVYNGKNTLIQVNPISVDIDGLKKESLSPDVLSEAAMIKLKAGTRKLIGRGDRTDPTKGLINGLKAYKQLMSDHPEMKGRTVFAIWLSPHRLNIPEYGKMLAEIIKLATEINSALYPNSSWDGIVDNAEKASLMRTEEWPAVVVNMLPGKKILSVCLAADAALVNPLKDGSNLVAKEFAVINDPDFLETANARCGGLDRTKGAIFEPAVIIASKNIGAYSELESGVIGVDPKNIRETSEALYLALNMPLEERRKISDKAADLVSKNDISDWVARLADESPRPDIIVNRSDVASRLLDELHLSSSGRGDKLSFIGLSTSWIKGYNAGNKDFDGLDTLMTLLRRYCSDPSNGMEFIEGDDETVAARIRSIRISNSGARGVALLSEQSMDRLGLTETDGIVLAGIDETDLDGHSYARVALMLAGIVNVFRPRPLRAFEQALIQRAFPGLGLEFRSPYRLYFIPDYFVGISMGGTKLTVAVYARGILKPELVGAREIRWMKAFNLRNKNDMGNPEIVSPAMILALIKEMIDGLLSEHNLSISQVNNIGCSSRGPVVSGIIGKGYKTDKLPFYEYDFTAAIKELMGIAHAEVEHDAPAGLKGEMRFGDMADVKNGYYVIQGTGLCGSAVVNGESFDAIPEITEPGHHIVGKPVEGVPGKFEFRMITNNSTDHPYEVVSDPSPDFKYQVTETQALEMIRNSVCGEDDIIWTNRGEMDFEEIVSGKGLDPFMKNEKERLAEVFGGKPWDYALFNAPSDLSRLGLEGSEEEKATARLIIAHIGSEFGKGLACLIEFCYSKGLQFDKIVLGSTIAENIGLGIKTESGKDLYISSIQASVKSSLSNLPERKSDRKFTAYVSHLLPRIVRSTIKQGIRETALFNRDASTSASSEINVARRIAGKAAFDIPSNSDNRYTVLMPNEFYLNNDEFSRHKEKYANRFNIDKISGRNSADFINNILAKTAGKESRSIALIPADINRHDLLKLAKTGVRFLVINKSDLLTAKIQKKQDREAFQTDIYAIMLLARHVTDKMPQDSPARMLLDFYIGSHFDLNDGVKTEEFIKAIISNNVSILIRGILSYKPAQPYALPDYGTVSKALISA